MDFVLLLSAVIVIVLSGLVLLNFIAPDGALALPWTVRGALAFLSGLGVVSMQLFFYSALRIPFSPFLVAAPWVVFGIFITVSSRRRRGFTLRERHAVLRGSRPGPIEILCLLVILFQVAYAFASSAWLPLNGDDAWGIWFLKGAAFFKQGSIYGSFYEGGGFLQAHPEYPLLLPLSVTWVYACLGEVNDQLARLLYPLQFVSLLIVFGFTARRFSTSLTAFLLTALLSLTPVLMAHAGGFTTPVGLLHKGDFVGYSDLLLSAYFLTSAGFIALYIRERRNAWLPLIVLFLALGVWTKDEGLVFAFSGLAVTALAVYSGRDLETRLNAGFVLKLAFLFALFVLPWPLYKAAFGLTSELAHSLGPSTAVANLGRIPLIASRLAAHFFSYTAIYGIVWYVSVGVLVINLRHIFKGPMLVLYVLLLVQLSAYLFVYLITPADVAWHMDTSLDRLLLHLIPIALLTASAGPVRSCSAPRGARWR